MFGLGIPELAIIIVIALIIFGPNKLPDMAQSLGKGIKEFKSSVDGIKDDVEASIGLDEEAKKDLQEALTLDGITQPVKKPAAESVPKPVVEEAEQIASNEVKEENVKESAAESVKESDDSEVVEKNVKESAATTENKDEKTEEEVKAGS